MAPMVSLTIWSNNTAAPKTRAISTLAATWIDLYTFSYSFTVRRRSMQNQTHGWTHDLGDLDIGDNLIINYQWGIGLPIPFHAQYPFFSWEIDELGAYLEFAWPSISIFIESRRRSCLPDIFDLTHPTSLPRSSEPGLGRVIVVALVHNVVPLCSTSVPAGSVKAVHVSYMSITPLTFRRLLEGGATAWSRGRVLTHFCPS